MVHRNISGPFPETLINTCLQVLTHNYAKILNSDNFSTLGTLFVLNIFVRFCKITTNFMQNSSTVYKRQNFVQQNCASWYVRLMTCWKWTLVYRSEGQWYFTIFRPASRDWWDYTARVTLGYTVAANINTVNN